MARRDHTNAAATAVLAPTPRPDRADTGAVIPMAQVLDDAPPFERPSPGSPRVNVQEAAARYAFAADALRTLRVLDVASGTGLGSEFLLTRGARFVVGVESAAEALCQARTRSAPFGPHFVRADARALPFGDASFDAVVSFETIEHLNDASGLLAECRRILRPGGCLYLSTPNRTVTHWLPSNPFHVREFTDAEIVDLVRQYFGSVTCFWQRPVFLTTFALRQIARRSLTALPGGSTFWRIWKHMRPRRTQLAGMVWSGSHFDESLLQDRFYSVAAARRTIWMHPTYIVLVAR